MTEANLERHLGFYRQDLAQENWQAAGESAEVIARLLSHKGKHAQALKYYRLAAEHTQREVQAALEAGLPVSSDLLGYMTDAAWLYWKAEQPEQAIALLDEVGEKLALYSVRGAYASQRKGLLLRYLLGQKEFVQKAFAEQDLEQFLDDPDEFELRIIAIQLLGRGDLYEETVSYLQKQIEIDGFEFWFPSQMLFDCLDVLQNP
ncbi:MAG: hypothetical protein JXA37_04120 [Chloroflexia bacterium]|nr:hypothetical protein [Chloroflexia bacterium]